MRTFMLSIDEKTRLNQIGFGNVTRGIKYVIYACRNRAPVVRNDPTFPTNLTLTQAEREVLAEIGGGNMVRGLQQLIAQHAGDDLPPVPPIVQRNRQVSVSLPEEYALRLTQLGNGVASRGLQHALATYPYGTTPMPYVEPDAYATTNEPPLKPLED